MAKTKSPDNEPAIIKKYANRRLYNTRSSCYVTLDHLADMVKAGEDFVVHDVKTGEDITRMVLAQIIFEKESTDANMLPAKFLRQLISFYDDGLQGMVPGYLQTAMEAFSKNQDEFRKYISKASKLPSSGAMPIFEEMAKQNMRLFEQAVQMFNPFTAASGAAKGLLSVVPGMAGRADEKHASPEPQEDIDAAAETSDDTEAPDKDTLTALQDQLAALQKQVELLSRK